MESSSKQVPPPGGIFVQPDFAAVWNALVQDSDLRDAAFDLAYWQEYAADYDSEPITYQQTLAVLASLVLPGDTVLDVGAGTGRFALPLAARSQRVTALDYSPAMLNILRRKASEQAVSNVHVLQADWEQVDVPQHDVVLAAWALYRQADLLSALRKLADAARRVLVIVDGDSYTPPHTEALRRIWGDNDQPDIPNYLYLLGALRQIGLRADLRIVYEVRSYRGASPRDIAQQLAPDSAIDPELTRYIADITHLMRQMSDGWCYTFTFPVSILIWERR